MFVQKPIDHASNVQNKECTIYGNRYFDLTIINERTSLIVHEFKTHFKLRFFDKKKSTDHLQASIHPSKRFMQHNYTYENRTVGQHNIKFDTQGNQLGILLKKLSLFALEALDLAITSKHMYATTDTSIRKKHRDVEINIIKKFLYSQEGGTCLTNMCRSIITSLYMYGVDVQVLTYLQRPTSFISGLIKKLDIEPIELHHFSHPYQIENYIEYIEWGFQHVGKEL